MRRTCALCVIGAAVISCAATYGVVRLTGSREMSIETAMQLVGKELSSDQRSIVIAALRRQSLVAIRQLRAMLDDPDRRVVLNAAQAIADLREEAQ